jgi:hypothetical protein
MIIGIDAPEEKKVVKEEDVMSNARTLTATPRKHPYAEDPYTPLKRARIKVEADIDVQLSTMEPLKEAAEEEGDSSSDEECPATQPLDFAFNW